VFVDTLGQISHVYNLTIDAEKKENLIHSNSKKIKTIIKKFKAIISNFPAEDAQPNYTKLSNSIYDINTEILNKRAEKWRKRSNHAPMFEH
jgi:ribosomal protein S20